MVVMKKFGSLSASSIFQHLSRRGKSVSSDSTISANSHQKPFWEEKSLAQMNGEEWESLCDGCGRCCLNKLEDWDTGKIHFTNIACTLLDDNTCRCSNYENRFDTVPDCIKLTPDTIGQYSWLPPTCAYRLLEEGKSLPTWHPLISGTMKSVHDAGISVQQKTVSEDGISVEEYEFYLVDWADQDPTK